VTVMKFPYEQKREMIAAIQTAFEEQFGTPIGNLGAEQWLDTMLRELAPFIYNRAIADARAILLDRMAVLENDLYALEKPAPRGRRSTE
jgi:uncharacterized protein (DUF2164 family)